MFLALSCFIDHWVAYATETWQAYYSSTQLVKMFKVKYTNAWQFYFFKVKQANAWTYNSSPKSLHIEWAAVLFTLNLLYLEHSVHKTTVIFC